MTTQNSSLPRGGEAEPFPVRDYVPVRHLPPESAGDPGVSAIVLYFWIPDLAMYSSARPE
jgi:hypothetical protein